MANKYVSPGGERRLPHAYDGYHDLIRSIVMARLKPSLTYLKASHNVLDLGCGVGWCTKYISLFVRSVDGIDASIDAIEAALRRNSAGNIRFMASDMADYCKRFDRVRLYDHVVSTAAIEHLTEIDMRAMIRNIFYLLTPGGYFTGTTTEFRERSIPDATQWHLFEPGLSDFMDMATSAGFVTIKLVNRRLRTPELRRDLVEGFFTMQRQKEIGP